MEKVLTAAAQSESAVQRPSRLRRIETVIQRRQRHAQARVERGADRAVLESALGTTPPSALTYASSQEPCDANRPGTPFGNACRIAGDMFSPGIVCWVNERTSPIERERVAGGE